MAMSEKKIVEVTSTLEKVLFQSKSKTDLGIKFRLFQIRYTETLPVRVILPFKRHLKRDGRLYIAYFYLFYQQ